MTIRRVHQAGFEFGMAEEWGPPDGASPSATVVAAKTGNFSLMGNNQSVHATASTLMAQARAGFYYRMTSIQSSELNVWRFRRDGTPALALTYQPNTGDFRLYAGALATLLATYTVTPALSTATWVHLGLDVRLHPTDGWFALWLDGQEVGAYTGQTNHAHDLLNEAGVYFTTASGSGLSTSVYFDDVYWDETSGQLTPARPPMRRFAPLRPNGNGGVNQWTGSDGDTLDNYLLVDETDLDRTDRVAASVAGLTDRYALDIYAVPGGDAVAAVIPTAAIRSQGPLPSASFKVLTYLDGASRLSAPLNPLNGWIVGDRQTRTPAGLRWDQTAIDALEAGATLT